MSHTHGSAHVQLVLIAAALLSIPLCFRTLILPYGSAKWWRAFLGWTLACVVMIASASTIILQSI